MPRLIPSSSSSSTSRSLSLALSPSPLFSANLFFAFYCLSLPALLWPVKLSPLTKWLMTKVNSPSVLFFFFLFFFFKSSTADAAPCVSLSSKRFPSSWLMETWAAWSAKCICACKNFHHLLESQCDCKRGQEHALTGFFFSSPLQTASNLLPKPGPPGNQHPQDAGTAVGKIFFTWCWTAQQDTTWIQGRKLYINFNQSSLMSISIKEELAPWIKGPPPPTAQLWRVLKRGQFNRKKVIWSLVKDKTTQKCFSVIKLYPVVQYWQITTKQLWKCLRVLFLKLCWNEWEKWTNYFAI